MRKFFYIILLFIPFFWVGCESTTSTTTASSVAKLTAFSFAKVDTLPGLASTVFTVEERLDTGLVWNKDSMLYGTRIDSAVPRFVFAATPGAATLTFPDTVVAITGYDTLDFNKQPIYLTIRSADRSTTKVYEIRVTVHQVDPDLFTWTRLTEAIYPADDSEQRVLELDGAFIMMVSNGFELFAYGSEDGADWMALGNPIGSTVRLHARDEIADGTLAHGSDLIGQAARVPFVFLLVLACGFVAMLVADADAAKRAFAVLRAVGATRGQLAARLAGGALRTAAWGIVLGLPVGALVGWLFAIKTGAVWPGLPHYFVLPWRVLAEGTVGALVFVLLVAVPTALILVARAIRSGMGR